MIDFLQTHSFLLHKALIDGRVMWYFYQLFELSFWRHPFTAEDQLVSKWHPKNQLIYILDGLKESKLSPHFNFWVNDSFQM